MTENQDYTLIDANGNKTKNMLKYNNLQFSCF